MPLEKFDFDEAIRYLDEHINLERSTAVAGRVEGLSLDKMRKIVDVLGDPQDTYPVVHLTGTNGKGSVARMASTLLVAHDLGVGTYTSPHLEHITERIAWSLHPIDPDEFAQVVGELATLEPLLLEELHGDPPSYFELLTAAAFAYFAQVAVEVAVVEVGLLGRYDATNVVEAAVAVVTNIGRDHTDGGDADWRAKIAAEKAGIITPGRPLVLGETDPALREVLEAEGPDPVILRGRDFDVESDQLGLGGHLVDLRTPHGLYEEVFLPVHGAHQVDNAACAVAAVEALFDRPLEVQIVRDAFAGLKLPGKFETLHRAPLLVVDCAHNPDGAATVEQTLADEFDVAGRRRWVLGVLAGRDLDEMLDALGVRPGDQVVACAADSPRALPAEAVAAAVAGRGIEVSTARSVAEALAEAWRAANNSGTDDAVVVTGSTYTAGEGRTAARRLGLV